MSVETIAYSIPPNLMRKIRSDAENLEHIFEDDDPLWKVEDYDFGKRLEEIIGILLKTGFPKTYKYLNGESYFYSESSNFIEYDPYEIWIVTPAKIKIVVKELEEADLTKIKAAAINQQITDYYGEIIHRSEYEYYIETIKGMIDFFKKVQDNNNFLLFAQA